MVKNLPAVERSTKIRFGKHVPDSTDQAENTIVINASNILVEAATSNAVYLSPIRNRTDYQAAEIVLLMYDRNTKEITESGESANALIGGSTLNAVVNRANATSNVVQFIGSLTGASFVTDSNIGVSNLLPQHTVSVGSNLYIDEFGSNVLVVSGNVAVLRDMIIEGNLTVNGDTTVIYTENTSIKDALIELGKDNTSADTTLDLGILMHRPDALSNVVIGYREGNDEFAIAYTDSKPTDKTLIPKTDEDINVHVYGLTHIDANIYAHEDILASGNVYVAQNVSVTEELTISGNVYADKDLEVVGNVYVSQNVSITEELTISGNVYADKDLLVSGNVYVSQNVSVTEELTISGNVYADKDLEVVGNVYVDGNVNVTKQLSVTGNAYVSGNVEVTKSLIVSANTHLKGDNVFITHTMDFLDPKTAIVTDQVSNVQIRLGQLENVSNLASNPRTNQVLRYVNNEWSNDYPQQNFMRVKNGYSEAEGRTLYKGNTVYVSATQNAGLVEVRAAQSHIASQMPCVGLVYEDIGPELEGVVLTYGVLTNLNTTHLTAGGTVYVSNVYPGYYTSVKPDDDVEASPDLIQNLGICTRSHQSSGAIFVTGIGRANDIPNAELITDYNEMNYVYVNDTNNDLKKITSANLNIPLTTAVSSSSNSVANAVTLRGVSITSGDGFNGDLVVTGNVTVDTDTFKVDTEANRVGILTSEPDYSLDVRGTSNVGIFRTPDATITDSTVSDSKTTGALKVVGGVGIQGALYGAEATFSGVTSITNGTAATDRTSGALKVTGGVGVQGDLYANDGHFTSDLSVGNLTDLNNKYLPMVGTDGVFVKSPVYVTNEGKYIISSSEAEFLGNITLGGNTTIISSTSITISDRIFGVGANNSATGLDSGFIIEHQDGGTFANVALIHHADEHRFSVGYTQNSFTDNHILHYQHDDGTQLRIDLLGNTLVQNNLTVNENSRFSGKVGIKTGTPGFDLDVRGTSNVGALSADSVSISDTTAAANKTSGALQVAGGVGVQGALYATNLTATDTVKGATLTGTLYGAIAGSNAATVTNLTASGTVKGATLTGTNLYGTISGSNAATMTNLTASGTVRAATVSGTNLYGTISGSNAATMTNLTASGTVRGATLTGTNLYGTISGSNTATVSTLTASGTIRGGPVTGTNLYGTISGSNTAAVSDLTATGTVKGATLTGTNLYGVIAGSNTVSATDITYSGTITSPSGSSRDKIRVWDSGVYAIGMEDNITFGPIANDYAMTFQMNNADNRGFWWGDASHTTAQGAMALSTRGWLTVAERIRVGGGQSDAGNPAYPLDVVGDANITGDLTSATVTVPNDGDFVMSGKPLQPAAGLHWDRVNSRLGVGTITPATKLHIAGGTIINSDQVAKKTYSFTDGLSAGQTVANSTIKITFSNYVFYAKVVAHLVDGTGENLSTISFECAGGKWDGTTPSNNIALGPSGIFGVSAVNPWNSAITVTPTTVAFAPVNTMASAGNYNIFIEYISQSSSGVVSKITEGSTDVVTFTY